MTEFMGMSRGTWFSVGLNAAFIVMNWSFIKAGANPLVSAMGIGWHAAIILAAVFVDITFLAPLRKEIREMDELIARYRNGLPPQPKQPT